MKVMRRFFKRKTTVEVSAVESDDSLVHIVIAGGSIADWAVYEDRFISIYPYGPSPHDDQFSRSQLERQITLDGVQISVHASTDGQERICQALFEIGSNEVVSEALLDERLFGDAGEPDLVVVLGPAQCLPYSLVWELAYSEIVFVDEPWTELSLASISSAIQEYALRHRRFGGVNA
jgi:undecaprenyl diphosphate synthase